MATEQVMNEVIDNDDSNTLSSRDELTLLKKRATQMGISFSPNIGIETLKKKINDRLEGISAAEIENAYSESDFSEKPVRELTAAEKRNAEKKRLRLEALKLVRIRVTCLNPQKKDLQGEILTVANEIVGTVRRYVPFNGQPWHVEQILFDMMKSRKFLDIRTTRDPKNNSAMIVKKVFVPEFAIEVLPPLTKEELQKLAANQAAAGSIDND